jgi:hypothetical protein
MRARVIPISIPLAIALSIIVSTAVVSRALGQGAERQATAGMAASGEVISESGGVLRLNTTPCRDAASVIVFRKPYGKDAAGEVNCKGARRSLVQVVQR